jgi:transcriptional regulator with XRE-family HTH domain
MHHVNGKLMVDWPALVRELRVSHGMTLHDIGREIGKTRAAISWYGHGGGAPSHATGEELVALWVQVTSKPREQLPKQPVVLSCARV